MTGVIPGLGVGSACCEMLEMHGGLADAHIGNSPMKPCVPLGSFRAGRLWDWWVRGRVAGAGSPPVAVSGAADGVGGLWARKATGLPETPAAPTLPRSANSRSRPNSAAPRHIRGDPRAGSVRAERPSAGHRCPVLSLVVALRGESCSRVVGGTGSREALITSLSTVSEESPSWQPLMPPGRAGASRV
jgi:hypothetical protein